MRMPGILAANTVVNRYGMQYLVPLLLALALGSVTLSPTQASAATADSSVSGTDADSSVSGTVADKNGEPERDSYITLFEMTGDGSRGVYLGYDKTEADGTFNFDLADGCYVITAQAPDGSTFPGADQEWLNQPFCADANQIERNFLAASTENLFSGQIVTGDKSSGAAKVQVDLFTEDVGSDSESARATFLGTTYTDANGKYSFAIGDDCYVAVVIAPEGHEFIASGDRYLRHHSCVNEENGRADNSLGVLSQGPGTPQAATLAVTTTQPEASEQPQEAEAKAKAEEAKQPEEAEAKAEEAKQPQEAEAKVEEATTTTAKPTTTTEKATTTTEKAKAAEPTESKSGAAEVGGYLEGNTSVPTDHFTTLSPGTVLPTGAWCATQVRSAPETRQLNNEFNSVRGTKPNSTYPRVDGNFTGTTDEIIQWAACKWGIDENIARAQAVVESWWDQGNGGDFTTDKSHCHPAVRNRGPECPESLGLLQIRWRSHPEAFEDDNPLKSTAYNVDFVFQKWRECYEGRVDWLNHVDRGKEYKAGDMWGCIAVWYAGRWHTNGAADYIGKVKSRLNNVQWNQKDFLGYDAWVARGGKR